MKRKITMALALVMLLGLLVPQAALATTRYYLELTITETNVPHRTVTGTSGYLSIDSDSLTGAVVQVINSKYDRGDGSLRTFASRAMKQVMDDGLSAYNNNRWASWVAAYQADPTIVNANTAAETVNLKNKLVDLTTTPDALTVGTLYQLDSRRIPCVLLDIAKGLRDRNVPVTEQTVEHLRNLCTGDLALGANGAVGVADHVSKVIGVVKTDIKDGVKQELVVIDLAVHGPSDAGQGAVLKTAQGAVAGSRNGVNVLKRAEDRGLDESDTESVCGVGGGLAGKVVGQGDDRVRCGQLVKQRAVHGVGGELEAVDGFEDLAGFADSSGIVIVSQCQSRQQGDYHQDCKKQADKFLGHFHFVSPSRKSIDTSAINS